MDSPGTDRPIEIVPSVLPADHSRLGEECRALQEAGVDRIQWDVMDGVFVPNLTFGPDVIAAARRHVDVRFEAHLMVVDPENMAHRYVEAGCDLILVHAESTRHLHRTLGLVRDAGAAAGVALNPATPVESVLAVLDLVEMVLVMTVNPGFGGQAYIPAMEPKIAALRRHIVGNDLDVDIEVDGGIGPSTVVGAVTAGANVLVAGSSLFVDGSAPESLAAHVADLRARAETAAAA